MSTASTAPRIARRALLMAATVVLPPMLGSDPGLARVWHVYVDGSGDAPTIQAAIQAATSGDEIVVHEGTFYETNLDFLGKEVWVHSVAGPDQTGIEPDPDPPIVYVHRGEGRGAILEGFRIGPPEWRMYHEGWWGGGISIEDSSPTIRGCRIQYLTANEGGGAACLGTSTNARFESCRIYSGFAWRGGGLAVIQGARAELVDCFVIGNYADFRAGGIAVVDPGSEVLLLRCTVRGNHVNLHIGTAAGILVAGGGSLRAESCTIVWNDLDGDAGLAGALELEQASAEVVRCIFYDNGPVAIDSRYGQTVVSCSDLWGSQGAEMLGVSDGGGNFSADPIFCWLGGEDNWLLRDDSPCLPGNHPDGVECGLIGRYGMGCSAPVPVHETTWGQIKWRMLDEAAKARLRTNSARRR